ncbi:hypothetical protein [Alteribacter natronophilus]|uniref:hypothetical protein n=1 Tax=Alteribacter natronophilus TaxID=2583810 RepID=UPI00110E38EB|nr:hypothetical protein [Alteribacter natronophilus]TMW71042.1 hypothetical protein FGB90_13820 [Alteribacter natronophilus]
MAVVCGAAVQLKTGKWWLNPIAAFTVYGIGHAVAEIGFYGNLSPGNLFYSIFTIYTIIVMSWALIVTTIIKGRKNLEEMNDPQAPS